MIKLSNGHELDYVVSAGALAYDGKGWPWERPLVELGIIKPSLFQIATKTLTLNPRIGNYRWWKPWDTVRLLPNNSMINAVGLTNPGINWWVSNVYPRLDWPMIVSIRAEDKYEIYRLADYLSDLNIIAVEFNLSCPNIIEFRNYEMKFMEKLVEELTKRVKHPIICKLASKGHDFIALANNLQGMIEAISFNSIPWKYVIPKSPLKYGGGGVSGKEIQPYNWEAMQLLKQSGCSTPLIASSIMEYDDIDKAEKMGADAVSFGSIHMRTPWKPTQIVRRKQREALSIR